MAQRSVNEGGSGSMRAAAGGSSKKAIQLLNSIQGLVCEWPLDFMRDEFKTMHPTALPGEIFK